MNEYLQENFHNWTPEVEIYQTTGRIAIGYMTEEDGYPETAAIATVNVPDIYLEPDEVLIKNYSENEGIMELMVKAGHIGPILSHHHLGHVTVTKHKCLLPIPE